MWGQQHHYSLSLVLQIKALLSTLTTSELCIVRQTICFQSAAQSSEDDRMEVGVSTKEKRTWHWSPADLVFYIRRPLYMPAFTLSAASLIWPTVCYWK